MTWRRMTAALACALHIGAVTVEAQGACVTVTGLWRDGEQNVVRLTEEGRTKVGKGLVTLVAAPDAPSDQQNERFASGALAAHWQMRRMFPTPLAPDGGVSVRLTRGRYVMWLERADAPTDHAQTGDLVFEKVSGCAETTFAVGQPGPWTPRPQITNALGPTFYTLGVDVLPTARKWGGAIETTWTPREDDPWAVAVLARRRATRGFFDLGARAKTGAWSFYPQAGFGLEMPPYKGHPVWIVGSLSIPTAPFDDLRSWRAWKPKSWSVSHTEFDLLIGVRIDVRRVRR